jgi:hypothetical protein
MEHDFSSGLCIPFHKDCSNFIAQDRIIIVVVIDSSESWFGLADIDTSTHSHVSTQENPK